MTPQLRILLIIDTLRGGGAQRQLISLALGLQARGHYVEFFYYWPDNFFASELEKAQIPVHLHIKSKRYTLEVIQNLRRVMQQGHFDAVLSFLDGPNAYTILAAHSLKNRPRVIVSERFYDPPEGVNWRQSLPRALYRLADHVTTNSHHQRETLERKLPWLKGRISTIYNGVDLSVFQPLDQALPADPLRLLVVATVTPYKNGLCLIQALDILAKSYQLFPCVNWVGEHVMAAEWGSYSQQMQQAIADYHLESQWTWLYKRNDIPDLMRMHHALVHPSYGEGLPNVVCEALASGLPVIVSDTLDHPRLVQHGITGYLFDWRDPQDLARWIKTFYDLPVEQVAAMSGNARAFAEDYLALAVFAEHYERLFMARMEN